MEDSRNLFDVYEATRPLWDAPLQDTQKYVDKLRRSIKYYFMNPCEKYHARGRKPWKLLLQLVKIAIITVQVGFPDPAPSCGAAATCVDAGLFCSASQLVSFGLSNQMVVTFKEENLATFRHLFLKNYADSDMESYAVYRQADVYDYLSYSIKQVSDGSRAWNVLLLYCWKSLLEVYYPNAASMITRRPRTGL